MKNITILLKKHFNVFFLAFLILTLQGCMRTNSSNYDIRDYGAREGENYLNTNAIQDAINDAFNKGGGTIIIPPGIYQSGTIILKDNTTLKIESAIEYFILLEG